jgi:hypothetical protein
LPGPKRKRSPDRSANGALRYVYPLNATHKSTRAEQSEQQLLATWRRAKGKERDALLWGDEIEYLVVTYDDDKREVRLSLRQADILEALASDEKLLAQGGGVDEIQRGPERYACVYPVYCKS